MAKQSKAAGKKSAVKKAVLKKAAPKKVAAKTADTSKGKLHGKTVAFVGKFGYSNYDLRMYEPLVRAQGGTIVKADASQIDYLFVGEGRNGNPPGDVAKIQKRMPAVHVMGLADFPAFLVPDRDELLPQFGIKRADNDNYWPALRGLCEEAKTTIDLTHSNLSGMNLDHAHLHTVNLNGSNLHKVHAEYTAFGNLEDVDLSAAIAPHAQFHEITNCKFRQADLQHAGLFYSAATHHTVKNKTTNSIAGCDFTGANLSWTSCYRGKFEECDFSGANFGNATVVITVFEKCDLSKADLNRWNGKGTRFIASELMQANLSRADLRDALLAGMDLRQVNLTGACLIDADLSFAKIDGADFQGAILFGTKFDNVDLSKAKNLVIPPVRKAGPKLLELEKAAKGSKNFQTSATVDLGIEEYVDLNLGIYGSYFNPQANYHFEGNRWRDHPNAKKLSEAILKLSERWLNGTLRFDSIKASGGKTVRGQKLTELAIAAWAETFGVTPASLEEIKSKLKAEETQTLAQSGEVVKMIRSQGQKFWASQNPRNRQIIDLRNADFTAANLDQIEFNNCDLTGCNFTKATLVDGGLVNAQCKDVDFTKSNLSQCRFHYAKFSGAKFHHAKLDGAYLQHAKLQGADFSNTSLKDTHFYKAQFDETTIWPKDFEPPKDLVWKGNGPRGGAKPIVAAKPGTLDFDTFLKDLAAKVESARMDKAGSMLKAERFQLFAEVKDTGIVGIVKSQSSGDLVYSCRLNSDGAFGCCTQNLRPCGGLRGALCKHLLVLIVGLAKAGQLDPATVNLWVDLSGSHKPTLEEDSMSATFLRYKGAESGELDWRPTETIPEDFYAM